MRFVSGGNNAKVVMVGSGGDSTKQAWPPMASVERVITLATPEDFETLPYQGFDGRTYAFSKCVKGIVYNGKFTPVENAGPTYEFRALDHTIDGAMLVIETVMPPNPKPLALPSMLVVSVKSETVVELVGVEYGANGFRIVNLYGGSVRYEQSFSYDVPVHSVIRVEKFLSWIQIYVNDIRVAAVTNPAFTMVGNPGVGLYSSTTGLLSTPIGPTRFFAGSSRLRTYGGLNFVERNETISSGGETEIMRMQVLGGRNMRGIVRNLQWRNNITTDDGDRQFRVKMNGVTVAVVGNHNGSSLSSLAPAFVPEHSIFTVTADVSTGLSTSEKQVESGSFELVLA